MSNAESISIVNHKAQLQHQQWVAANRLIEEFHTRSHRLAIMRQVADQAERERLNQQQRIDRAKIEADDAAENERQVKLLEHWLIEQGQRVEKGGVL